MFTSPSLSGSPIIPSTPFGFVAFKPFETSQPSGIPSPSVSQPSGSSSAMPSPSSSSEPHTSSPSRSGSCMSVKPSLSLSMPSLQMSPTGSSSQRITLEPLPSEPGSPQPGWLTCIASSSFQLRTGTVPFHQTPLSSILAVLEESQPRGMR